MTEYNIIIGKEISYDFFLSETSNLYSKLRIGKFFNFTEYELNPLLNLNQSLQFTSVANIVGLGILIANVEKVLSGEIESTRFPLEDVPLFTLVNKDVTKEQDDESSIPTSDFLKILKLYKDELDKYYNINPEELKQAIEYYNQASKDF
jgi:hypothetical protein